MTKPKGYTTNTWNDLPNYECAECSWSTLDKDLIEEHVSAHPARPAEGEATNAPPAEDQERDRKAALDAAIDAAAEREAAAAAEIADNEEDDQ